MKIKLLKLDIWAWARLTLATCTRSFSRTKPHPPGALGVYGGFLLLTIDRGHSDILFEISSTHHQSSHNGRIIIHGAALSCPSAGTNLGKPWLPKENKLSAQRETSDISFDTLWETIKSYNQFRGIRIPEEDGQIMVSPVQPWVLYDHEGSLNFPGAEEVRGSCGPFYVLHLC